MNIHLAVRNFYSVFIKSKFYVFIKAATKGFIAVPFYVNLADYINAAWSERGDHYENIFFLFNKGFCFNNLADYLLCFFKIFAVAYGIYRIESAKTYFAVIYKGIAGNNAVRNYDFLIIRSEKVGVDKSDFGNKY